MNEAKFASLAMFEQNLEFKASLLDARVDAQLLSSIIPSPAQVFREAYELDGASTDDIKIFLKALKEIKGSDNEPLVTRDGLGMLTNVLFTLDFVRSTIPTNNTLRGCAYRPLLCRRCLVRECQATVGHFM
jgi:hypothetical protein